MIEYLFVFFSYEMGGYRQGRDQLFLKEHTDSLRVHVRSFNKENSDQIAVDVISGYSNALCN